MTTDTIRMLADGKMSRVLLKLCLPSVAAMAINGIYNVVDAFFIGLTEDTGAIGAVSVIFPLFIVMTAFGIGISIGAGSFMTRSLGCGAMEKARRTGGAAILFSVLLGLILTAAGYIFMEPMLYLLGARETIMPYAIAYTTWILGGSIFPVLNSTLTGTIRAEGNTIYSTIALLAGTLLNIVIDPVLIFALGMGIRGAAIATLLSYVLTFIISVRYYRSKRAVIRIRPRLSDIDRENTREIMKIGVPAMIKQLLLAGVFGMINMLAAGYGEYAVTAAGICAKINSFVAMTMLGIAYGFMPVASFNYGARNMRRVMDALKKVMGAELAFAALCGLLYMVFSRELMALFCKDAAIIDTGKIMMTAFAAGMLPLATAFVMDALFSACGKAKASMLFAISRQGLVFIPVVLIGNAVIGLMGVAWASAIADTLSCLVIAWPLFRGFRKQASAMQIMETHQINRPDMMPS